MPQPKNPKIEAILSECFPKKLLVDFSDQIAPHVSGGQSNPELDKVRADIEAARTELAAMPSTRVDALHGAVLARQRAKSEGLAAKKRSDQMAKAATKEAARFCNQPSARADFAHWSMADYWTLDEAVALMLSKEPGVVNPQAFERESKADLGLLFIKAAAFGVPTGFALAYRRLRSLMERAETLPGPRLKPSAVIEWARRTQAVDVPEPLRHLAPQSKPPLAALDKSAGADVVSSQQVAVSEAPGPGKPGGTLTTRTPEELASMAAYRDRHGTKAAAEHFGISGSRLRALLPRKPKRPDLSANWASPLARTR